MMSGGGSLFRGSPEEISIFFFFFFFFVFFFYYFISLFLLLLLLLYFTLVPPFEVLLPQFAPPPQNPSLSAHFSQVLFFFSPLLSCSFLSFGSPLTLDR